MKITLSHAAYAVAAVAAFTATTSTAFAGPAPLPVASGSLLAAVAAGAVVAGVWVKRRRK